MKIYLDLVFIINFFVDFILLYGTKIILKKVTSIKRIIIGSLVGTLTTWSLFISLSTIELFILKIILSILIIIITFGKKDFKNTLFFFYVLSIILGGTMYLFNITEIIQNNTVLKNKYLFYTILIILLTFIIIHIFIKVYKKNRLITTTKYQIEITINNKKLLLEAILDTGNHLVDPYKKRPIILIDREINYNKKRPIYVPYKALNTTGIIKCILPDKVIINNKEFKNCLIGLSKDKFSLNGASCILPNKFKEDLC